jgi:hypothetical protein
MLRPTILFPGPTELDSESGISGRVWPPLRSASVECAATVVELPTVVHLLGVPRGSHKAQDSRLLLILGCQIM